MSAWPWLRPVFGGWENVIERGDTVTRRFLPWPATEREAIAWAGLSLTREEGAVLAREVRRRLRWGLRRMAATMDVGQRTVQAWEAGALDIPRDALACYRALERG